jgi:hypothetical protein
MVSQIKIVLFLSVTFEVFLFQRLLQIITGGTFLVLFNLNRFWPEGIFNKIIHYAVRQLADLMLVYGIRFRSQIRRGVLVDNDCLTFLFISLFRFLIHIWKVTEFDIFQFDGLGNLF